MGHNPATRDVQKADRKQVEEKRTPEAIIKGIRGNLAAHLAVTPNDTAFLLATVDGLQEAVAATVKNLEAAKNLNGQLEATINTLEFKIDHGGEA